MSAPLPLVLEALAEPEDRLLAAAALVLRTTPDDLARRLVSHFLHRAKADALGRTSHAMGTAPPAVIDGMAALAATHDVAARVKEMAELDQLEGGNP